jgi:hypothetical protein
MEAERMGRRTTNGARSGGGGAWRWRAAGIAAVTVALAVPALAQGTERSWSATEVISDANSAMNMLPFMGPGFPLPTARPTAAIAEEGRALVGWVDFHSDSPYSRSREGYRLGVMAAEATESGWSAPDRVADVPGARYLMTPTPPLSSPPAVAPIFGVAGARSVAWHEGTDGESWTTGLRATRTAGGWASPERLELPAGLDTWRLSLWRGQDGAAHAVTPGGGAINARRRAPSGEWSAPDVLPGRWHPTEVTFDGRGAAVALLRRMVPVDPDFEDDGLYVVYWSPEAGWSQIGKLGVITGDPALAQTSSGEVIVAWQVLGASREVSIRSAVWTSEGGWSESVEIDRARPVENPWSSNLTIATANDGDAILVRAEASENVVLERPAGGTWSESSPGLPTLGGAPGKLLLNDRGDAIAVWAHEPVTVVSPDGINPFPIPLGCRIDAAIRPAGGNWSAPRRLLEPMRCFQGAYWTDVALSERGDAVVLHTALDGPTKVLRAASAFVPAGRWDRSVTLSSPGVHAIEGDLAINGRGDAVAVWEETDNGSLDAIATRSVVHAARSGAPPHADPVPEAEAGPADARPPHLESAPAEPVLLSAVAAVRPAPRQALQRDRSATTYLIRLRARGAVGARLELTHSRRAAGTSRAYAAAVLVRATRRPAWARLVDAAGRASAWRRVALDRARPSVRAALRRTVADLRLSLDARDDASGVARMQVARNRSRPGRWVTFTPAQVVPGSHPPRWARVQDGMGRLSPWVPVRAVRRGG